MGADPETGKKTVKKARYGIDSRWQVSQYAEQPDGTKRLVSRNFERLTDAEAFRTKTEHQVREGSYRPIELEKKTFADASAAWLAAKKRPSGASLFCYRDALDLWSLPKWSRRILASIRREEIDAWVTELVDGSAPSAAGGRIRGGWLSPAGLTAVWVPFKASLAHAVELGWIASNPARGVELPKSRPPEKVFLDYGEVERLVAAAREVTGRRADAVMIELMAYAGLRPGEVVALQVQHLDLPTRRIKIRRTATIDVNGRAIFGEPKHGERREVPIAPHIVEDLEAISVGKTADAPLLGSGRVHQHSQLAWPGVEQGGRCSRARRPRPDPQALRHTAASMAIAAGADVKVVQRMLGHADASMTLNTYADLWPDRLDEVVEAVSRRREAALRG